MKSNAIEMTITNKKRMRIKFYKFLDRNCSKMTFHSRSAAYVIFRNVPELISENAVFIIHMIKVSVRLCVLEFAATT